MSNDYHLDTTALHRLMGDITYKQGAKPVKTYCPECGQETGEEMAHADACICFSCRTERMLMKRATTLDAAKGKTISFRRFANLSETSER